MILIYKHKKDAEAVLIKQRNGTFAALTPKVLEACGDVVHKIAYGSSYRALEQDAENAGEVFLVLDPEGVTHEV